MTAPEIPSSPDTITSDIPTPRTEFLEEPHLPKPEDFKDPENYTFALEEYKHKLSVYQARLRLVQAPKEFDAEQQLYAKNIDSIEQEIGPIDWHYSPGLDPLYNQPLPFKISVFASTVRERHEYNIITDQNSQVIYLWTEKTGTYSKYGELYLQHIIDKVLEEDSTTQKINQTIELLKIRTYATMTPSTKIAVQNGLLDITTGKIEKFTKAEFVTNKLKTDFIEGAKSEAWEKFIEQVCPNDKLLLQEWSGYLLIKGYLFHAMMWLYGPKGRNGKGTWARTMESILGFENYSAVSIDEFDGKHRFAIFNLHDSLFNICSEPRTDRMLTVEMLQSLTGMDALDAERKGVQERFKFFNTAKMTVMGNKFPNVDKPTDAFWERLKLIKFPYTFTGDSQIQDIEKTWLDDPQQRAGILNWMIEGALRLLKNHGFTMTKTQEETVIQFKRATDSRGAFIAECIEFDAKAYTPKVNAFDLYKTYCEVINVPADTNTAFNKVIRNIKNKGHINPSRVREKENKSLERL